VSPARVYELQGDYEKAKEYYLNECFRLHKEYGKYRKNIICPSDEFYIIPDSNIDISEEK